MRAFFVLFIAIFAFSISSASAETLTPKKQTELAAPAIAAYARGDFATALRLFRYFAEQGDSGSQAMLGTYYVNGEGVPKNYVEALKWFRRSADQGDAIGQYQLGVMYHNGQGVPQNDAEAAKWLRLSAAQGYAAAQGKLAILDRKTPVANTLDERPTETAVTAAAIAVIIVKASRDEYYATGHPCACPDDVTRNGRSCGNMSAYIRPGGAHPLCSPADVTTGMIEDYRKTKLTGAPK
jgi:TPR repeat protein